jgi:hypothetical protein
MAATGREGFVHQLEAAVRRDQTVWGYVPWRTAGSRTSTTTGGCRFFTGRSLRTDILNVAAGRRRPLPGLIPSKANHTVVAPRLRLNAALKSHRFPHQHAVGENNPLLGCCRRPDGPAMHMLPDVRLRA